jgi:hypothetical protein
MIYNATHESSMIQSSSYNTETGELSVTFNGGNTYKYERVTNEDYTSFVDSESTGKGFNEFIRKYEGQKLITEVTGDNLKGEDNSNLLLG